MNTYFAFVDMETLGSGVYNEYQSLRWSQKTVGNTLRKKKVALKSLPLGG
jgi:hypothetical protein